MALLVVDPFDASVVDAVVELLRAVQERQVRNRQVQERAPRTKTCSSTADATKVPPQPLVVYNLRADKVAAYEQDGKSVSMLMDDLETRVQVVHEHGV